MLNPTSAGFARLRVRVKRTDGSRPVGKVVVRSLTGHRTLATARLTTSSRGRVVVTFPVRVLADTTFRVVYKDQVAPVVRITGRVPE